MEQSQKEYLVNRIIAGFLLYKNNDEILYIKSPTKEQKYLAEEHYREKLEQYILEGFYDDIEYLDFLVKKGLWDEKRENFLKEIRTTLENLKVELFESEFKSNTKKEIKKNIKKLTKIFEKLHNQRTCEIHKSASGLAGISKLRYLIGISLFTEFGPVFNYRKFWELSDNGLLDQAVEYYNNNKISDVEFRELARTEPWRIYWACRKACSENVFGVPSSELTDDQKSLIYWSLLYDNVYENPDCPSNDVIEDDDALDGFLIKQHREREAKKGIKSIEDKIPSHLSNAQEVFLPAETIEDARKIHNMNTDFNKAKLKSRDKAIGEKGILHEVQLPDVYANLKMQMVNEAHNAMKSK